MKNMITLVTILGLTACDAPSAPTESTQSQQITQTSTTAAPSSGSLSQSIVYKNFAYVAVYGGYVDSFKINPDTGEISNLSPSVAVSMVPTGSEGVAEGTCYAKIHPNGNFLFASNCLNSTIAPFVIGSDGSLTPVNPDTIANAISTNIANVNLGAFAIDSTGSNLYVEGYKTTNNTRTTADYLYRYSINTSTGAIAMAGTVVSNTLGNDLVGNYLTTHSLGVAAASSVSLGVHTYQINNSTSMIDQYDSGSLSAYSAIGEPQMYSIVFK